MSLRQNAFTWAPATPTRSRQSGLCVMGRVGCIGRGGDRWRAYGGKRGTVGAPRVSGASEGRGRKWCAPTVGQLPMAAYQRTLGSNNNRLHLLSAFS